MKITYFVHGTTFDNASHKASGWYDVELSELGIEQSKKLKEQTKDMKFDVVFCSDLKRAVDTANLAFKDKFDIIQDKRLRECNYGDFTQHNSKEVSAMMPSKINEPFTKGESYKDVEKRIRVFLKDAAKKYKHIAIVAHRAPQLAIEVITKGISWEQAMKEDWRHTKAWKPGWEYNFRT